MMMDRENIRTMADRLEATTADVKERQEDVKAVTEAVGNAGCDKAAFKLAVKLRGLEPLKAKAFLDSFDACRDALDLDAQLDLIDAINETEANDPTVRIGDGPEMKLSTFKKAARRVGGRPSYDA
jgi:uncharacterized protein (UPF0335 family)